jgi:predicted phosphoribosyltransferase
MASLISSALSKRTLPYEANLKEGNADHVDIITAPSTSSFKSVGQYYQNFEPISDPKVIQVMKNQKLV